MEGFVVGGSCAERRRVVSIGDVSKAKRCLEVSFPYRVPRGELWLSSEHRRGIDSRYFGGVSLRCGGLPRGGAMDAMRAFLVGRCRVEWCPRLEWAASSGFPSLRSSSFCGV